MISNQEQLQQNRRLISELSLIYLVSAGLRAAVEMGIPDLLKDGPRSADELAQAINGVNPGYVHRLLRTLAGYKIFAHDGDHRFRHTSASELLCADHPDSCRDVVKFFTTDEFMASGIKLTDAVTTGTASFELIYQKSFFDYLAQNPSDGKLFHAGMAAFSAGETPSIIEAYDFSPFSRIVDVGGGRAGLLIEILKHYPSLHGILYDRPEVAQVAQDSDHGDVRSRMTCMGGNFLASVPDKADAYVIKRIIHNWDDESSIAILRNCQKAMTDDGRVLVIDAVIEEDGSHSFNKIADLLMMIAVSGHERNRAEFERLFSLAGLTVTRVISTSSLMSIIEGKRA